MTNGRKHPDIVRELIDEMTMRGIDDVSRTELASALFAAPVLDSIADTIQTRREIATAEKQNVFSVNAQVTDKPKTLRQYAV